MARLHTTAVTADKSNSKIVCISVEAPKHREGRLHVRGAGITATLDLGKHCICQGAIFPHARMFAVLQRPKDQSEADDLCSSDNSDDDPIVFLSFATEATVARFRSSLGEACTTIYDVSEAAPSSSALFAKREKLFETLHAFGSRSRQTKDVVVSRGPSGQIQPDPRVGERHRRRKNTFYPTDDGRPETRGKCCRGVTMTGLISAVFSDEADDEREVDDDEDEADAVFLSSTPATVREGSDMEHSRHDIASDTMRTCIFRKKSTSQPGRDGPFVSRGRPSQFRRSEDSSLLHAEERKGAFETVMGQAAFVSSKTGTRTPPEETN